MSKWFQISNFLKFYSSATTKYRIHSPFVFDLIQEVVEDDRDFYSFRILKRLREDLADNKSVLEVTDLGAGSHTTKSNIRSIASISKSAVSPVKQCEMMFRLVQYFKPATMLEFGTSLGLNSLYQSTGYTNGQLITMEGSPEIAQFANSLFKKMDARNIVLRQGNFDTILPEVLTSVKQLDYVFFDGNHRKAPTLAYFEQCVLLATNDSVFVFDDIYWSAGMREAWETIKKDKRVTLTVDLYFMGLVFFRKEQKKQEHYKIVPAWAKPWIMGFFK